jgi:hypothetical protein
VKYDTKSSFDTKTAPVLEQQQDLNSNMIKGKW